MTRRVVVTGMGVVTPLGLDVESTWRGLVEGRSGIGGVYDGWRRLAAAVRGRRFDPSHEGHRT